MKNSEPAVVVVAYNRGLPLQRLLNSLKQARYPDSRSVALIISIDFSDGLSGIQKIAEEFEWIYGPKRILSHENRLGLRAHILKCGDLCEEFGSVIILEDDLTVSPGFYDFLLQALPVYSDDPQICGISLYQTTTNPEYKVKGFEMVFSPVNDGFDNFFIQHVSSWGQCWTLNQWREFRQWLEMRAVDAPADNHLLPKSARSWPDTSSWAKYFQQFMIECGKYFVFPNVSLSTNWGEKGTNFRSNTFRYQVPLLLDRRQWRLSPLNQSSSVYDAYHEMEPFCLKRLNPDLEAFDFECDLYSVKEIDRIQKPYVLTTRNAVEGVRCFGSSMFPLEANVIFKSAGTEIKLVKSTDLLKTGSTPEAGSQAESTTIRFQTFEGNLQKYLAFEALAANQKEGLKALQVELRDLKHACNNGPIRTLLWLRKFFKNAGRFFKSE
jgi:hypothetical protein